MCTLGAVTTPAATRCCTTADEERFRGLIESAIQRKEVPRFTAFREKTGRGAKKAATKRRAKMDKVQIPLQNVRRDFVCILAITVYHSSPPHFDSVKQEAAEAEELMAKLKKRDTGRRDAASLSAHRSKQFDNMVCHVIPPAIISFGINCPLFSWLLPFDGTQSVAVHSRSGAQVHQLDAVCGPSINRGQ